MSPPAERRRHDRHIFTSPLAFYRVDYQDNRHDAQMVDCGTNGLALRTDEKLVLGEFVCVEMKDSGMEAPDFLKKQNYGGIVRWGKRYASTQAGKGLYKYGIELSTESRC